MKKFAFLLILMLAFAGLGSAQILTSVSPTSVVVGQGSFTVTATGGFNCSDALYVFINNTGQLLPGTCTVTTSPQSLTATVPAFNSEPPGNVLSLQIYDSSLGTFSSASKDITVVPAPSISSVVPSVGSSGTVPQAATGVTLSINGANFVAGDIVKFGSTTIAGSSVQSSTLITVVGADSNYQTAGTISVTVVDPSSSTSNAATLTVAAPNVTSTTPSSAVVGTPGLTLKLNGTNIAPTDEINFGGTVIAPAAGQTSTTQVSYTIPANKLTTTGPVSLMVLNSTGSTTLQTVNGFSVVPAPVLTSVATQPAPVIVGGNQLTLTLTGSNFTTDDTVLVTGPGGSPAYTLTGTETGGNSIVVTLSQAQASAMLASAGTATAQVISPGGGTSSGTANFTIQLPPAATISSLSPTAATAGTQGPGGTGFQLTISGTNFLSSDVVNWQIGGNTIQLSPVTVSNGGQTLTVQVTPAAVATAGAVTVSITGPGSVASTNTAGFTVNPAPTLQSLSKTSVGQNTASFTETLTGTNFTPTSTVLFQPPGSAAQTLTSPAVTFISATSLTVNLAMSMLSTAGSASIGVKNGDSTTGFVTTNLQTLTITPQPTISQLSPASAVSGLKGPNGSTTLTVTGTNFVTGDTVSWTPSGSTPTPLNTTFVSATSLTAQIPDALLANSGSATVTVTDPNGATSNGANFVISSGPTIDTTRTNPASALAGVPSLTIHIIGSGYVANDVVIWTPSNGNPPTTLTTLTLVSATQIDLTVPASLVSQQGSATVVVKDPTGAVSNAFTFTILAGPSITSLSQTSAVAGTQSVTLTIIGTNLGGVNAVRYASNSGTATISPGTVTSTSVQVTIGAQYLNTPGPVQISVVDTSGAISNSLPFTVSSGPVLASLNPTSVALGVTNPVQLTLTGAGFILGDKVRFGAGGPLLVPTSVTPGQNGNPDTIVAPVPVSLITGNPPVSVLVDVLDPSGVESAPLSFTIRAAPSLTNISPKTAIAGSPDTVLTLTGVDFVPGDTVLWRPSSGPSTTLTPDPATQTVTNLKVTLPGATLLAQPDANVQVSVIDPSGVASGSQQFMINPGPAITNLSPSAKVVGSGDFTLTITGSGFDSTKDVITWCVICNGSDDTVLANPTFGGANGTTQIVVTVPAALIASPVQATVKVTDTSSRAHAQSTLTVTPAPVILSLNPTSIPAGTQGFTLTINGTNLPTTTTNTVQWISSSNAQITTLSPLGTPTSSTLTVAIPANLLVKPDAISIKVGDSSGVLSQPAGFAVVAPTVTSTNPISVSVGGAPATVMVSGTNFIPTPPGSKVIILLAGSTITLTPDPTTSTPTQLVVSLPTQLTAGQGQLYVQNPGNTSLSGASSNQIPFTVNKPLITGLNPNNVILNGPDFTLTVTGNNFVQGAQVLWAFGGGNPVTLQNTNFVSATTLTATVPANLLTASGNAQVSVLNVLGSTPSDPQTVTISPITVTNLNPTFALASGPQFTLTVTGSNFAPSAVVQWTDSSSGAPITTALATTVLSTTQVQAVVPAALITNATNVLVSVANSQSQVSGGQPFQVLLSTLTGVTPNAAPAGSPDTNLTVTGTNFVPGAVVAWNAGGKVTNLSTTFVSSSQVTAVAPTGLLASPGSAAVSVINQGNVTTDSRPFSINAPSITPPLQPVSAGVGGASFVLTVTGTNFLNGSTVTWNNGTPPATSLVTTYGGPGTLTAVVPANLLTATATVLISVVNPGSASPTSNGVQFAVGPSPTIDVSLGAGIAPSSTVAGSPTFQITVTGTNFQPTSTVDWDPGTGVVQPLATSFISSTQLQATVPASLAANPGTAFVTVLNPGGAKSNTALFTIGPNVTPIIDTLSPATVQSPGATFALTVHGSSFVSGAVVQWNNGGNIQALGTTFVSSSQLTALVPASLTAAPASIFVTVLNPGGATSAPVPFSVTAPGAPTIANGGLNPGQATAGAAAFQILITGTNFQNGAVAQWNTGSGPQPLTTSFVNDTQLSALVPANLVATAGIAFVTVQNPDKNTSNAASFTINAVATPIISTGGLAPPSTTVGGPPIQLTVSGSNFVNGSVVQWNSGSGAAPLATSFISSTQLSAVVPANLLAAPGTVFVSVSNPPSNITSNQVAFTVNSAGQPTINSSGGLTPATATAGTPTPITITVTGTNYVNGSVVEWNSGSGPQALTTGFTSSTQLTAVVPVALLASAAQALVTVLNPDRQTSNSVLFSVSTPAALPPPVLNAVNPSVAITNSPAFQLALTGQNFVTGAVVLWNANGTPQSLVTTFSSVNGLTALVPASLLTTPGTAFVSVQNPDKQTSNLVGFTINSPGLPTIANGGVAPSTAVAGVNTPVTIAITGTNFVNGAIVQWNSGSGAQTLTSGFISSTQLTAVIPASLLTAVGTAFVTVQNPNKDTSNSALFTVTAAPPPTAPLINTNGLAPSTTTSGGPAFQVVITGLNFQSGAVAQWTANGTPTNLTTTFDSATQITALVPAALITAPVTAFIDISNPGGVVSNLSPFVVNAPGAPTIAATGGVAPSTAGAGSGTLNITVTGTNFVSGAVVQWNSGSGAQALTTGYISSTQLSAVVPATLLATAGTAFVSVQNPDKGTSNSALFTITPPSQPTITTVTPTSASAGGPAQQLTVMGSNFVNGSTVQWNVGSTPQPLTTTFVSATELTAFVPANLLTTAGNAFISVTNPPGGVSSNLVPFNITSPGAPTISTTGGLAPSTGVAGSPAVQLTVTGTGFVNGSLIQWNSGTGPQSLTTGYISSTQLSALVPASLLASAGTAFVTVLNPDKTTSNSISFTIATAAPPTIANNGLVPANATAGGPAFQLSVTGSNFVNGAVVNWNGGGTPTALTSAYISPTQITALVPASLITTAGTVFVSVTNPNSGGTSNLASFAISTPGAATVSAVGGLVPSSAPAGSPSVAISVIGTNFQNGAVVMWNGGGGAQALTTGFINSTQLSALVPATLLTTPGTAFIYVVNADKSTSNSSQFTISGSVPVLTSLSQPTASAGIQSLSLSALGSGFSAGTTLLWNSSPVPTTVVSSSQLTATITANLLAKPGTVSIQASNGAGLSNSLTFSVNPPAIALLSPSNVTSGFPAFPLTVSGSDFLAGAVVLFNNTALTTTYLNPNQLTAMVPAALVANAGAFNVTVSNPGGAASGSTPFTVGAAATIAGISPTSASPGTPGLTLTVNGSNFSNGDVVQWNGFPLTTTFGSATQLTAAVPANLLTSAGPVNVSVLHVGGVISNSVVFNLAAPSIATLAPTTAPAGAPSFQLIVTGASFVTTSQVQWNGTPLPTTFGSATQLTAQVDTSLVQQVGNNFVTVVSGGASSGGAKFTVVGPTLASLSPNTGTAGATSLTLQVTGTNFVPGSVVVWNGTNLQTTFASATSLSAVVPQAQLANPGTVVVLVTNPGGATSGPQTFALSAPAPPTITGLNPPTGVAGGPAFQMTVTGTGFVQGSSVQWNGVTLGTSYLSSTQLAALVDSSLIASAGTANVAVQNPGAPLSTSVKFVVSGPTITSLSPNTAAAGGPGFSMAVTGTNFIVGSAIQWNSTTIPTSFNSAQQLTASVPASYIATAGTASVTVQNPGGSVSPGSSFTVGPFTLAINTNSLVDAVVNQFYSQILSATGGSPPYMWSVSAGSLPQGLNLDPNTGTLSGSATAASNVSIGFTVTDSVGRAVNKTLTFRSVLPLTITNTVPLPVAPAGAPYALTFTATGGTPPYSWALSGAPPIGITLNAGTGVLSGIPTTPGVFQFTVTVSDSRQQIVLQQYPLTVTLSNVTIMAPTAILPATQPNLTLSLGGPYGVDLTGDLTLTFTSSVGGDDPSVQFTSGGKTVSYTLPNGSTTPTFAGQANLGVSTGTVAGSILVKATVKSPTGDVTPSPAPSVTIAVPKEPPVITNATLTKITGGVSVGISGYSTTRELTTATFHFNPAPGATLNSSDINISVASLFTSWYASSASNGFGSQFTVSFPFSISGNISAIGSVTITLANTQGTSQSFTANIQ